MSHRAVLLLVTCLLTACGASAAPSPTSAPSIDRAGASSPTPSRTASAETTTEPPVSFGVLEIGSIVTVAEQPLIMHAEPSSAADRLDLQLTRGMRAGVAEGPVTAGGDTWYRFRVGQADGWAVAGSREGVPWVASVQSGLIAFGQEVAGQPQVFVVRSDGSHLLQLTRLAAGDDVLAGVAPLPSPDPSGGCARTIDGLRWAPDGGRLALSIGACQAVVVTVGLDGTPQRVGIGAGPAWSPDGTRLVYAPAVPSAPCALDCYAAAGPLELHLADADAATDPTPLTANEGIFAASTPEWSPDGRRIAYAAVDGQFVDQAGVPLAGIYVVNADGSGQTRLATGSRPRWSPDGTRIAYADASGNVVVTPASGDDAAQVVGAGTDAAWSPDGTRLAIAGGGFTSIRSADDWSAVADVAGEVESWAPDGSEMVLTVQRFGGGVELHRYSLRTGEAELLLGTDSQSLTSAAWQPVIIRP